MGHNGQMLLPKAQPLYENLSTSFTHIGALLEQYKSNHFTGYIQLCAREYEGVLLMDSGQVAHGMEVCQGRRLSGPAAIKSMIERAHEKEGTLSVYRLSPDLIRLLASVDEAEPVYKDLSSDFAVLDKLIAKLQSDHHTGYVEVQAQAGKTIGMFFLQEGEPIESLFSTNGTRLSGARAAVRILQAAAQGPALYHVYRTRERALIL